MPSVFTLLVAVAVFLIPPLSVVGLVLWARRLRRQGAGRVAVWTADGLAALAGVVIVAGMVPGILVVTGAIKTAGVEPSGKARALAEEISAAMNSGAFVMLIVIVGGAGLATRGRWERRKTNSQPKERDFENPSGSAPVNPDAHDPNPSLHDAVGATMNQIMGYEPPSKLAADVLMGPRFTPFAPGFLLAQTVADQESVSLGEAQKCLAEFAAAGLLAEEKVLRATEPHYKPTVQGWRARERLLRDHGLRHFALANQKDCDPRDLVIALIMAEQIFNERTPGGVFVGTTERTAEHLTVYLGDYADTEIAAVCDELVQRRLLRRQVRASTAAFDLDTLGRKAYLERIGGALHIAAGETILDPVLKKSISVFYAWQSEFKRSRNMIGEVLPAVLDELNKLDDIVRPLERTMATDAGDGAVRIDQQLLDRVKGAEFFVGDTTPVSREGHRLRVNDNVLVETGYALASKAPDQIILLSMKRDDFAEGNPQVAFDIAMVRRHEFDSKDSLRRRLLTELMAVLRKRGWLHRGV